MHFTITVFVSWRGSLLMILRAHRTCHLSVPGRWRRCSVPQIVAIKRLQRVMNKHDTNDPLTFLKGHHNNITFLNCNTNRTPNYNYTKRNIQVLQSGQRMNEGDFTKNTVILNYIAVIRLNTSDKYLWAKTTFHCFHGSEVLVQ